MDLLVECTFVCVCGGGEGGGELEVDIYFHRSQDGIVVMQIVYELILYFFT